MGIRVLVVEDVPELRSVIRHSVRLRPGFEVVAEAGDGRTAIRAALDHRPDLVVLDLGLPDLAGREVLSALREAAPDAQVVVYSGAHSLERFEIAPRVEGFVPKEHEIEQLIDRLVAVSDQEYHAASIGLGPSRGDVAKARRFVVEHVGVAESEANVDDARLVVSELVTNALIHSSSDCNLRISMSEDKLRLEVTDEGPGVPEIQDVTIGDHHGRGLRLVSALSAAWGVDAALDGRKVVWAVLPAMRAADALSATP